MPIIHETEMLKIVDALRGELDEFYGIVFGLYAAHGLALPGIGERKEIDTLLTRLEDMAKDKVFIDVKEYYKDKEANW